MNPLPSSEDDEQDTEIIKLLKDLESLEATYPIELLAARRAGFLARLEELTTVDTHNEGSNADQEIVTLLGAAKSTQADYPPDLLAARQAAFVRQIETLKRPSRWDRFRVFIQKIFQPATANPTLPPAGLIRISLLVASLVAAVFLGSLFARTQRSFTASPPQLAARPTSTLPSSTSEAAMTLCKHDDGPFACLPGELNPSQDLAYPGNGPAFPAVSKDARPAHQARVVNDGHRGASWVSNSADSWIKIDLGQVRTINTVSLENGNLASSQYNNLGSFVIAVALSDVYADGDSNNDDREYAQVFHSEQAGFSGTDSHTEMITVRFSPVEARFVKITFEKEGASVEEVGVFMAEPPVLAEPPTRTHQDDLPGTPLTTTHTSTLMAAHTSTSAPTDTQTLLPTDTQPAVDTSTPVPGAPLPTLAPPTAVQPTAILPTVQPTSASTEPIVVTESDQTLTFTCNGNAAEIRGHANTVTLLGSCSSITVTGNGNLVFWQFGSPVITTKGNDNIVLQL